MGGIFALMAYSAVSCTVDGANGGGGDGDSGPSLRPADGIIITGIDVYQGIRRPLMENGAAVDSQVPIVLGRDAMFRILYHADPGTFNGLPLTVRVHIGENQPPIETQAVVGGTSNPADLNTTINVGVPGTAMVDYSYRVELLHGKADSSGNSVSSIFPAEGQAPLAATDAGQQLKVILVPIAYNADGSGRLPDTSPAQLQLYADYFKKIYPIPNVEIIVGATTPWGATVSPNGAGWSELLQSVTGLRQQYAAAPDEYYYGIFSPAQSIQQFCGGGCVAGLSWTPGPTEAAMRAGIGLGFTGMGSTETAAHEVGHSHGLWHAPCGTNDSLDANFPYGDGSIGTYGYDLITGMLVGPELKDLMSYCDPVWVSDYHFTRLFDRLRMVNMAMGDQHFPDAELDRAYERVVIDFDGSVTWSEPLTLRQPPQSGPVPVTVTTEDGPELLTGHYYPHSHIAGGMLLFPETSAQALEITFEAGGISYQISR